MKAMIFSVSPLFITKVFNVDFWRQHVPPPKNVFGQCQDWVPPAKFNSKFPLKNGGKGRLSPFLLGLKVTFQGLLFGPHLTPSLFT